MEKTPGTWRYNLVYGVLMLAVGGLGVRLWLLLRRAPVEAAAMAVRQQRMVVPLSARPGNIFARTRNRYVLMAASRQMPSCYADPLLLADRDLAGAAVAVARVLGLDPLEVQNRLILRRRSRFIWLKRDISDAEVRKVQALRLPAIGVCHEWRRVYPNDKLGGTVVGFRCLDGRAGGGMELAQARHLVALDGKRVMLADAFRRPIWPLVEESSPPRDGGHVFLTLDLIIQGYLQEAVAESVERFGAKWGTGVVVNPNTGEVLAMCSVPTFDPNRFNRVGPASRVNRAITVPFEPGSIAKPIFAAAAVDAGLVRYDTKIFCENGLYRARRGGRITDHGQRYGWLTVEDIVVKSSNIGMTKVGEKLGNEALFATARRFGFGQKTGLGLPGESRGIVRELPKWDGYSLRRVPFGQEISVTALQMTMAFCPLVNGGLLVAPRLVDHLTDAGGRVVWQGSTKVVRRVLAPAVARKTLGVLRQVVERGTGKACRMARWTSLGKTGTAQIPGQGGYVEGAYTGSFIGGAPATGPRVLCMISIYWPQQSRGYYGSKVAAPYVRQVLQRTLDYLGVPPDQPAWVRRAEAVNGLAMKPSRRPAR